MKKILMLMAMIGLLTACGGDEPTPTPPTPPTPARRTVVVYMAAENDLSRDSYTNLTDMITGRRKVADDENLVVFVDRANVSQLPFIAKVTKNEAQPLDTLYKYTEDFYASDPAKFTEVLQRIVELCPATEDYGLVLWGHASGWIIEDNAFNEQPATGRLKAYGLDNGNNQAIRSGKWMNIPALRQALEQLGIRWKFIFCDCCNMQCAEVAYELRNVTEYMIASPAEITGIGAPYATIVKDLFIHDDVTMYTAVCDDYHAQITHYIRTDKDEQLPISTVRTDKMEALALATRNVLPAIADYVKTAGAMDGLIYYYSFNKSLKHERMMYDINDVIRKALGSESEAYQYWKAVLDEAVLSPRHSSWWHAATVNFNAFPVTADWNERQGVISMFFPLEQYNYSGLSHQYNETIKQMEWYQATDYQAVGW